MAKRKPIKNVVSIKSAADLIELSVEERHTLIKLNNEIGQLLAEVGSHELSKASLLAKAQEKQKIIESKVTEYGIGKGLNGDDYKFNVDKLAFVKIAK